MSKVQALFLIVDYVLVSRFLCMRAKARVDVVDRQQDRRGRHDMAPHNQIVCCVAVAVAVADEGPLRENSTETRGLRMGVATGWSARGEFECRCCRFLVLFQWEPDKFCRSVANARSSFALRSVEAVTCSLQGDEEFVLCCRYQIDLCVAMACDWFSEERSSMKVTGP